MINIKQLMIDTAPSIFNMLDEGGYLPYQTSSTGRIEIVVNGWKLEYHISDTCFKIGYESKQSIEQSLQIREILTNEFEEGSIVGKKNLHIKGYYTAQDFKRFLDAIELCEVVLDEESSFIQYRTKSHKNLNGVLFEGSNFSNAHERATTIGNRFMKLVCAASGMSDNYDAEWPIVDAGRIDGVEIDDNGNPISIYECQSGIQNGDYLDDEHLHKSLMRYPSDPAILPTLKKIVILAGGYSNEHLIQIKFQAENLSLRKNPIEVILLKTNKIDNKINVEVVNYK